MLPSFDFLLDWKGVCEYARSERFRMVGEYRRPGTVGPEGLFRPCGRCCTCTVDDVSLRLVEQRRRVAHFLQGCFSEFAVGKDAGLGCLGDIGS
jgi:hypothetical protein